MKRLSESKTGLVFLIAQFLIMAGSIVILSYIHIFPVKYMIYLSGLAVVLLFLTFFSQKSETFKMAGRVFATIFILLFAGIAFYGLKTYQALQQVVVDDSDEMGMSGSEPEREPVEESFYVYISGVDVSGEIKKNSRSDVNMVITVNPKTKQIHLTATPRDYYVPLANSNGVEDKLTHAGEYGVQNSLKTLEMLYDVNIDYYIRVNFTSLSKIVDTLGGVTVYSDYTFTSDWGPSFVKGYNEVNGAEALAFCRERHHFAEGDRQRIKNHQYMFEAIFKKIMSPSILSKYLDLLKVLSENVQTNMKVSEITDLAKMQMKDGAKWKITSYSVDGTGARRATYSYPSRKLYVMIPNKETVEEAKLRMKQIFTNNQSEYNSTEGKD